ncbi:DUF4184 family protein [Rodentibacter trehalosifermentans]|uniref:Uncharacterized protein n=1 Tax=Rodentibacter trehalosifermentans TaxID=1908263 RepID=A0A1V3IYD5_9PAST|nr:DUF4184 family protein [Rodentibacter trehalosifermentans]OOF47287.1 hypothetical protein BKK51_00050 [Rodentibacter trehalosifermentans]OOF49004.1 hypothetical protein BKK52_04190 [Rodentibacter trehalosifermentans]OOF53341.1 hypothetical protein BKK53_01600 [Rodentibacter trehalosifermentans]
MPFTLAHPAIILPLSGRSFQHYFYFPALILGSMSPDFIYYLSGKPTDGGHTIFYSEWLNLPLCFIFYYIYLTLLKTPLWANLPCSLSYKLPDTAPLPYWKQLMIFLFSAWFGMVSHIFLDNFTHGTGYFVQTFPFLQKEIYFPIYKWLQYGSSAIGLIAMGIYLRTMAKRYPYPQTKSIKQKQRFWVMVLGLSGLAFLCWNFILPIQLKQHGILIVRTIDCLCLTICLVGLFEICLPKSKE